jgi:opacity protein-like surface antigen
MKHFLMAALLVALATPGLNAADPIDEIDIGLIIEPTASHISGYLEVLAARKGVRSVAVAVPDQATLEIARR